MHHCALVSLIDVLDARFASFQFKDENTRKVTHYVVCACKTNIECNPCYLHFTLQIQFLDPFFEQACTKLRQEQNCR